MRPRPPQTPKSRRGLSSDRDGEKKRDREAGYASNIPPAHKKHIHSTADGIMVAPGSDRKAPPSHVAQGSDMGGQTEPQKHAEGIVPCAKKAY